jgi:nicotinamidase-related amidase
MSTKLTTMPDVNGYDWQIRTSKNYKGVIQTYAQAGFIEKGEGYSSFGYELYGSPNIILYTSTATRATEKALDECHKNGLRAFEIKKNSGELPVNKVVKTGLPLYTKLISYGYAMAETTAAIISEPDKHGTQKFVTMSEHREPYIGSADRIKPVSEKFGIGVYYVDSLEQYPEEEVKAMIEKAEQIQKKEREEREAREAEEARIRAEGEAQFNAVVPSWAKGAIIAEFMIDDSDIMSDYFSSHADKEKTMVLAWTTSDRNDMAELKNAARNHPETASMPQDEHRENYSGGHGFYLGNKYRGWKVSKHDFRYGKGTIINAIGRGNVFAPANDPQPTTEPNAVEGAYCKVNESQGGVEIYFTRKPAQEVIDDLKSNGFRWAKYNKCWYKKDSSYARATLRKYAPIPGEEAGTTDAAAGMVQAQEDAYFDNFCQRNNI